MLGCDTAITDSRKDSLGRFSYFISVMGSTWKWHKSYAERDSHSYLHSELCTR